MTNQNLPVKSEENFVAEFEVMDLTELKGKTYFVGVNTGDRSKVKFLASTIRGPYTFEEMCEEVGVMWKDQQHHAKVVVATKKRTEPVKVLDENTVDYIEANFVDIVTESMLEGVFDDDKEYTCRAGIVEGDLSDEPAKLSDKAKEDEDEEEM